MVNPPYVPTVDAPTLQPEVRRYEPAAALFGGEDGLHIVRRLLDQVPGALAEDGVLLFEFGAGQESGVRAAVAGVPPLTLVEVKRDLQDIPRIAVVEPARR